MYSIPALLLNNPAYHLLLSEARYVPSWLTNPPSAQEKPQNVPQGKRRGEERGRTHILGKEEVHKGKCSLKITPPDGSKAPFDQGSQGGNR